MDKDDIKKLRDEMELSQGEFGALVYANYHTIGKWESGTQKPRPVSDAKLKDLWRDTFGKPYIFCAKVKAPISDVKDLVYEPAQE